MVLKNHINRLHEIFTLGLSITSITHPAQLLAMRSDMAVEALPIKPNKLTQTDRLHTYLATSKLTESSPVPLVLHPINYDAWQSI